VSQLPVTRITRAPGPLTLSRQRLIDRRDNIRAMRQKIDGPVWRSLSFTFFFSLVVAAPCPAQHTNEPDSPCAHAVVTSEKVGCLSKAKDASDAKLNSVYERLRSKLEGEDADNLLETQRIWTKYRDANCSAERALYGGGTAAHPAYLACIEAMTRARIKELQITYAVRLKD
jgi:uncharacterized protein YecT (DUF1311 family)